MARLALVSGPRQGACHGVHHGGICSLLATARRCSSLLVTTRRSVGWAILYAIWRVIRGKN